MELNLDLAAAVLPIELDLIIDMDLMVEDILEYS